MDEAAEVAEVEPNGFVIKLKPTALSGASELDYGNMSSQSSPQKVENLESGFFFKRSILLEPILICAKYMTSL